MAESGVVERIEEREDNLFFQEHLTRYQFAASHLRPGWTLDIATGTGYGAALLEEGRELRVLAADLDLPTLHGACRKYARRRITFMCAHGLALPFGDGALSNIVTLETIEHIEDDSGYLRELARVLAGQGTCILSTPDRSHSQRHKRPNPFHVREYDEGELRALLGQFFDEVTIYYQGFSADYHERVRSYAAAIQAEKRQLAPMLRFGIDRLYRPLKACVPVGAVNLAIRLLLRRRYPQPATDEIAITEHPLEDTSVFIAVLRRPKHA